MTSGIPGGEIAPNERELAPNERREAARAKAKALRQEHRKRERRSRAIFQGILLGVVLLLAAIVAVIFLSTANRPETPGPRNMLSDGILIGEGFEVKPTSALQPGQSPVANDRDETSDVLHIQMYVDYFCAVCAAFDETNGEQISTLVESGAATVEIFPYAIFDSVSQGSKYSTRSANAAACVADTSPQAFYEFNHSLFTNQPEQGSAGLSDDELIALAEEAGATSIEKCVREQQFEDWVVQARERHRTGPVPNSDLEFIEGTPTVLVNGLKYTGANNDAGAFGAFMLQAAGSNFTDQPTEQPTAEPTPTPTPTPTKKR